MARDYHNKLRCVVYLGVLTGKEFEQKYMEISNSPDKVPVASTLLPVGGDSQKVMAWIFYEMQGQVANPKKQPIRVDL